MTKVIKRNGKVQKFDPKKIRRSIAGATREAKLPLKERQRVVREASRAVISVARRRKEIRATELRNRIVKKLNATEPAVARAWRKYEKRRR